jgi:hypothetical protein
MTERAASVRRVRSQEGRPGTGFIVTWDVDTRDRGQCSRLRRHIYGYALRAGRRRYRYPGFVEKEGVRYLGQSVLFVPPRWIRELREAFRALKVEHAVVLASIW